MKHYFFLFLFVSMSFAHPHAFIELGAVFTIQNKELSSVDFVWKMDAMGSAYLIKLMDKDGDGKFNAEEKKAFEQELISLKQIPEFPYIFINDEVAINVSSLDPRIEGDNLIYTLSGKPYEKITLDSEKMLEFCDPEYYTAFSMQPSAGRLLSDDTYKLTIEDNYNPQCYGVKVLIAP
jgi:ABC-type uncharacterized transport system substrate-binding protein